MHCFEELDREAAPLFSSQGVSRSAALEDTFARIRALMGRMEITRVANVTGLDRVGIPVVAVTRPNARSVAVSQGKGLSLLAAKVSGLMESIEGHHAEHTRLSLRHASIEELSAEGLNVADVHALPLVAGALEHGRAILWAEAWDVLAGCSTYVPYECVHTDYRLPLPTGAGVFTASSNGLASGNTPAEAVAHGVCELLERDAVTLHQLSGASAQRARRLDLGTVDDRDCCGVLARFESAGFSVAVWDVTSDADVACFACTVAEPAGTPSPLRPVTGSGCHPRRELALLRALTEAAQGRLTLIAGARDDLRGAASEPAEAVRANDSFHRELAACAGSRPFSAVPTHAFDTTGAQWVWLAQALRRTAVQRVAVVDLRRPELGDIPVFRVIAPGLEGMSEVPGFRPGVRARRVMQGAVS